MHEACTQTPDLLIGHSQLGAPVKLSPEGGPEAPCPEGCAGSSRSGFLPLSTGPGLPWCPAPAAIRQYKGKTLQMNLPIAMNNFRGTLPGKAMRSSMSESFPHRSTISCSAMTAFASDRVKILLTFLAPSWAQICCVDDMQCPRAGTQTHPPVRVGSRPNNRVNRRHPCTRCAAGGVSGLLQLLPNPAKQKASAASKEMQRLMASGSEDVAAFSQAVDVLLESKLAFQEQSLGGGEWQVTTASHSLAA